MIKVNNIHRVRRVSKHAHEAHEDLSCKFVQCKSSKHSEINISTIDKYAGVQRSLYLIDMKSAQGEWRAINKRAYKVEENTYLCDGWFVLNL